MQGICRKLSDFLETYFITHRYLNKNHFIFFLKFYFLVFIALCFYNVIIIIVDELQRYPFRKQFINDSLPALLEEKDVTINTLVAFDNEVKDCTPEKFKALTEKPNSKSIMFRWPQFYVKTTQINFVPLNRHTDPSFLKHKFEIGFGIIPVGGKIIL